MTRVNESRYEALCNTIPGGEGARFVRGKEGKRGEVFQGGIKGHRDRPG